MKAPAPGRTFRAFVIGAASSGAGKTTLTLGLIDALKRRGLVVQPFKAGPDYIDPGHHSILSGRPSYNLDTWMMGVEPVRRTFLTRSYGADVSVVEGVMGLFDGKGGISEEGSTAHLAKALGLPVILVVNAEKAARSVAALVKGFDAFDPELDLKWVVFNRVSGPRHFGMLKGPVEGGTGVRVLGYMPKDARLAMEERHLGLVTSGDMGKKDLARLARRAGLAVEEFIDLDSLLRTACKVRPVPLKPRARVPGGPRIAVALDRAFSFYYEENIEILKNLGAEVVYFSPVTSKAPPRRINGIYIGGGYPELYARDLEGNRNMREWIRKAASAGLPVYAECGGLMYLGSTLEDLDGRSYSMAGVFPWKARMLDKRKSLGYREVTVTGRCPFMEKGERVRGHEFHYSGIGGPLRAVKRVFSVTGSGRERSHEGYSLRNTLASYVHLHFASNPAFAEGFVSLARETPPFG